MEMAPFATVFSKLNVLLTVSNVGMTWRPAGDGAVPFIA